MSSIPGKAALVLKEVLASGTDQSPIVLFSPSLWNRSCQLCHCQTGDRRGQLRHPIYLWDLWCSLLLWRISNAYVHRYVDTHCNDVIMSTVASHITNIAIAYSIVYSGAHQRNHQSSTSLAFCEGNSPVTGELPVQLASNAENVSIWWRHHVYREYRCFHEFLSLAAHYVVILATLGATCDRNVVLWQKCRHYGNIFVSL